MTHLTIDTLIDYIHRELDIVDDAGVHAHLQTCGVCRSEYERETRLSELLKGSAADAPDLPSIVKAKIWQEVRAERQPTFARIAALFRPAIAIPLVAALASILYFSGPFVNRPANVRTVDANYYFEQHAAEAIGNPLGERSVTSSLVETTSTNEQTPALGTATAAAAALDAVE
jgi:predicted anti-sigma-YlaC factor YlaD